MLESGIFPEITRSKCVKSFGYCLGCCTRCNIAFNSVDVYVIWLASDSDRNTVELCLH